MTKYFISIIAALIVILGISVKSCRNVCADRDRLFHNQRTLMSDVRFYRTKDSLSAVSVERLVFSNREFKKYCGDLEEQVNELRLSVKRLQSVSQAAVQTTYQVNTMIRDSIVHESDTLRCIDYRDDYLTLVGCIENNNFSGIIESCDTITQIVHRVPRKFLFIKWGCKAIRQEIICKNPYSRLTYTKYIELKK